tara:strand:- start:1533 stop:1829 length:297 start_codon:yes stop_codon:yes gene_type:complete
MAYQDTYKSSLDTRLESIDTSNYSSSDTNAVYNTGDVNGNYRNASGDLKPSFESMYSKGPIVIYGGKPPYAKENDVARILMKKTDNPHLQADYFGGRI